MITKSKGTFAKELAGPLLTRDDIAALLVAYHGAVSLDQARVDQLQRDGGLPRKYDGEHWKENRERHLGHIELLLDTLSLISPELLVKLTVLAATRKPAAVREVLIRLFSEGVCAHLVGERMWSAPEFFSALVKEADQAARETENSEDTIARMMRWLDPVDPLRIAQECGYKKSMPSRIWK